MVDRVKEWRLVHPTIPLDQLYYESHIFEQNGRRNLLHLCLQARAPRCLEWLLKNGCNPNALTSTGCHPLHLAGIGCVECVDLLIGYGVCVNVAHPSEPEHSVLYHWAVEHSPRESGARLFWAGARLNGGADKKRELMPGGQCIVNRDNLLQAEYVVKQRVQACRRLCIALLVCMPGPRDCTRDWVRRLVWSTRDRRVWYSGTLLPYAYQRREDREANDHIH